MSLEQFEHINLMEIDPSFKPIPEGFYTLQLNSLKHQVVTPKSGKNQGKEVLILKGSFTVVNDESYSGRKLWNTFWTTNPVDLKSLRKVADATGMAQAQGQPLTEYADGFSALNPPAEFKVFIAVEKAWQSEEDVNVIKFNQAQPS